MNKAVFCLGLTAGLTLMSCSTILNNLPGVYSLDIEQGNMIDQSMVDQLKPNMSKRQVIFIMGNPMLSDIFHDKRWDYVYSKQPSGEERVQKRISLFFNGDNLASIQGDFHPENEIINKPTTETSVELPKRDFELSMWEKITGLFGIAPSSDSSDNSTSNSTKSAGKSGGRQR